MRLVDLVKERSRKLALAGLQPVLFAQSDQLGIISYVNDTKRIVIADAKGDFASCTSQVLNVKQATASRVKDRSNLIGIGPVSPSLGCSKSSYSAALTFHCACGIRTDLDPQNIGKNCFGRSLRVELEPSRLKFLHSNAPSSSFWSNRSCCSAVRGSFWRRPLFVLEQKIAYSWHCAIPRSVILPDGFERTATVPRTWVSPKTSLMMVISSTNC
jgi:hypothetical protein